MKRFLLMTVLMLSIAFAANAQLYAPCYANYQGVGYFVLPNGYYYGQIYAGYPQGEGYYYFVDPQMGAVFYHGYFDRGLCNGQGEVVSKSGYICGTWSHGDFVSQTYVQTQQMQQSYYAYGRITGIISHPRLLIHQVMTGVGVPIPILSITTITTLTVIRHIHIQHTIIHRISTQLRAIRHPRTTITLPMT